MSKSKQPPADPPPPSYVPVCAIGASAGGVGALQTLFRLLPDDLGLAYIVVFHLSPDRPSAMHEILGACTGMPVHQVTDGPKLRANCVYVIAPDSELVIEGDDVKSRPFTDPRSRRTPIDMFFRSVAAGRGDGIAVVLTGAGSDSALGVRAIKEGGGIVMVQEPAEAGFPSMPQNAIATGVADVVTPIARLAERIAEAAHSFRDPENFIALSHRVIRPLLESRSTGEAEDELRAWVVGCATGEEAYSLVILLLEEAEQLKVSVPIQIFPPDLDKGALATARESHAAALEASAPPSALVDAEQGVLHLSPSVGQFVLLSAGPPSGRLPSIVRPELRLDLKLALDRTFDARQPTITRPLDVVMEGDTHRVSLHVAPPPIDEGAVPRAIMYFLDSGPGRTDGGEEPTPPDELQHLHSDLKVGQEAESAGRIRNESAVQRLRASNEELQSLNEEYRSTAEELETSKEELQSINEELQTVNAELKSKLGVISAAHNDLQNLTSSSEIGTLFLDCDLRIRMFTPPVAELINVAEADIGRPITNFTHRLKYDGIADDVRRLLRELTPFEREVRASDSRCFLVRMRPYRTIEGKVEGAVITFDDITERQIAGAALRESEAKYRTLFETIDEGFAIVEAVKNDGGRVVDMIYRELNPAHSRLAGFEAQLGERVREILPELEDRWLHPQPDHCRWGRVAANAARRGLLG